MKILVIDDMRQFTHLQDAIYARTSQDGIEQIRDNGPWDYIFWDHDLGGADTTINIFNYFLWEHDAKDLIDRLEEELFRTPKHYIITANPVGGDKIDNWLRDFGAPHVRKLNALDLLMDETPLENLP